MKIPEHIKESVREFKTPLTILLIVFSVFVVLYSGDFFSGEWDTDIFGGLATEIAGVLLTFILLESYITHRDKKQFEHKRQIALRSLSMALRHHFGTTFNMLKESSLKAGKASHTLTKPNDFFNDNFYNTISYLDFSAKAPVTSNISWGQYLAADFKDFFKRLENSIDKYGAGLTPIDLDLLETLISSSYPSFLISVASLPQGANPAMLLSKSRGGGITFMSDDIEDSFNNEIKKYYCTLVELTNIVNKTLTSIDRDSVVVVEEWGSHVSPQIGAARVTPS